MSTTFNEEEISSITEAIADLAEGSVRVTEFSAALAERVRALEERVAEQGSLEYKGTFEDGVTYPRNSVVTHAGATWLSLKNTAQRPGNGDGSWRLIAKGAKA